MQLRYPIKDWFSGENSRDSVGSAEEERRLRAFAVWRTCHDQELGDSSGCLPIHSFYLTLHIVLSLLTFTESIVSSLHYYKL